MNFQVLISYFLDITSSCLYVAGIAAQSSRKYTPISLMIVVVVLYFFRSIYTEVSIYIVTYNSLLIIISLFVTCLSRYVTEN